MKRRFISQRFEVIEANGIENILSSLQNLRLDIVIIGSFQKNITDGLERAKEIRRRDRQIPIILVTKYSSENRVIAALREGVNDYLRWPFTEKELIASIRRIRSSDLLRDNKKHSC